MLCIVEYIVYVITRRFCGGCSGLMDYDNRQQATLPTLDITPWTMITVLVKFDILEKLGCIPFLVLRKCVVGKINLVERYPSLDGRTILTVNEGSCFFFPKNPALRRRWSLLWCTWIKYWKYVFLPGWQGREVDWSASIFQRARLPQSKMGRGVISVVFPPKPGKRPEINKPNQKGESEELYWMLDNDEYCNLNEKSDKTAKTGYLFR